MAAHRLDDAFPARAVTGDPRLANAILHATMEPTHALIRETLLALPTYLNDEIFADDELLRQIHQQLVSGRLVTIRRGFKEPFAERMSECLNRFSGWRLYEDYSQEHFHYRHHNIYDDATAPTDLNLCREIFSSRATAAFAQRISGRECSGRTSLSASWYLPGDYSLPHSDRVGAGTSECRQVAFVWHLTKEWRPDWGGELFWCPAGHYLTPAFNTLNLFNVTRDSMHFVTPVSPYAQAKRLAINGWWTGPDVSQRAPALPSAPIHLAPDVDVI
jgi:Rps23 Pro-64 3,4-dihydroxylase Tpa1-like proline 4-hydroxylase